MKFAPPLGPSSLRLKPCGNTRTCTYPLAWKPAHAFRRRLTHSNKQTLSQTKAWYMPQSQPQADWPRRATRSVYNNLTRIVYCFAYLFSLIVTFSHEAQIGHAPFRGWLSQKAILPAIICSRCAFCQTGLICSQDLLHSSHPFVLLKAQGI